MDRKTFVEQCIDERAQGLIHISELVWEYAEGGYQEHKSVELLCGALEKEGFTVTQNLTNIPTAFKGVWGAGKPVIGILGEYDALPGLSQQAGCTTKAPREEGARGHGCGHNMLGTGALAGAIAIKEYLKETGKPGTVIYFGTPAEENGAGKAFMARDGAFDGVDYVYTWHPGTTNGVNSCHMVGLYNRIYSFKGVTAHAGGAPHLGRSALDSVELMNVGVNYLREHVIQEARIHYAYLDAGGTAPNVVQDHASVRYVIRAPYMNQVKEITARIDDIARGAALMCGTQASWRIESAYSDYIPNAVLATVMTEAMKQIGAPQWTKEDYALAAKFDATVGENNKAEEKTMLQKRYGKDEAEEKLKQPLDTKIEAFDETKQIIITGSTDVGDVGYIAPTVMCTVATASFATPGHSWQMTAQGNSPIGHKGMLIAGKVIALASIMMLEDPEKVRQAKEEFMAKNGGVYDCALPKELKAPEAI